MQERILKDLILKDEDYVFEGDLTITGRLIVEDGSIRVSGRLLLKGDSELSDSHVWNGNIIAHSLRSLIDLWIYDGDIIIKSDAKFCHIDSNGDIIVEGSSNTRNVICRNYLVSGDNISDDITATEDIYILGCNESGDLKAREIFLGDICKFSPYGQMTVIAKHFECVGPIKKCRGIQIG